MDELIKHEKRIESKQLSTSEQQALSSHKRNLSISLEEELKKPQNPTSSPLLNIEEISIKNNPNKKLKGSI